MHRLLLALLLCASFAKATTITLDLSPFGNISYPIGVYDYFSGGTVINGQGVPITGPNYGITSSPLPTPIVFTNAQLGANAMSWVPHNPTFLFIPNGFTGFSFDYIWTGAGAYGNAVPGFYWPVDAVHVSNTNGSELGSVLGTAYLSEEGVNHASLSFNGVANEMAFGLYPCLCFGGDPSQWQIGSVTLTLPDEGTPSSAPEPAGYAVFGTLLLYGAFALKRWNAARHYKTS